MANCAGMYTIGDNITYADCFLVPQIRNALLAGIVLKDEFPILARVWENLLHVPEVMAVLEDAGGIVQPLAFNAEIFEIYAKTI